MDTGENRYCYSSVMTYFFFSNAREVGLPVGDMSFHVANVRVRLFGKFNNCLKLTLFSLG